MDSTKLVLVVLVMLFAGCSQIKPNPYVQAEQKPETSLEVQQAAALAFISYVGESLELPDDQVYARIHKCMKDELKRQPLASGYKLAWGPKVHRFHGVKLDDNMIYAVWQPATGNLVIAIRGTNFKSLSDWIDEDFYVSKTVEWPSITSKNVNARISQATDTGLNVLKALTKSKDHSLFDVIAKHTRSKKLKTITVTGHSLAGALAPVFALWLKEMQEAGTKASPDDSSPIIAKSITFSVIPLAGATPGNAVFAKYYDEQLGEQTNRLHNPYDVVPLAWHLDDMRSIKGVYWTQDIHIKPTVLEAIVIDGGIDLAYDKDYAQINASQSSTWGQINTDACYSTFAEQAAWQHHSGYCNALDMTMPTVNGYCVSEKFCEANPYDAKCAYLTQINCAPLPLPEPNKVL